MRFFFRGSQGRHALRAPKPQSLKTICAQAESSFSQGKFTLSHPGDVPDPWGMYRKGHLGHPGMSLASDCEREKLKKKGERKRAKIGGEETEERPTVV